MRREGNGGGTGREKAACLFLLGQGDNQLRTIKLDGLDVIVSNLFLPFLNHYRIITSLKFIGTIRESTVPLTSSVSKTHMAFFSLFLVILLLLLLFLKKVQSQDQNFLK